MSKKLIQKKDPNNEIPELSFEQAMKELESIIENLESGKLTLEDSAKVYTRGAYLHNYCEDKLKQIKFQVDNVMHTNGKVDGIMQSDLQDIYSKEN